MAAETSSSRLQPLPPGLERSRKVLAGPKGEVSGQANSRPRKLYPSPKHGAACGIQNQHLRLSVAAFLRFDFYPPSNRALSSALARVHTAVRSPRRGLPQGHTHLLPQPPARRWRRTQQKRPPGAAPDDGKGRHDKTPQAKRRGTGRRGRGQRGWPPPAAPRPGRALRGAGRRRLPAGRARG